MIEFFSRLLSRPDPALSPASAEDAAAFATLHAAAFQRGWSEAEFERLLADRAVVAHRAMAGTGPARHALAGFVLSRIAADQAEILSIAVAAGWQGRGLGRKLIDVHLRQLVMFGVGALFLEVDEDNAAARRLYDHAGFRQVGRRPAYYPHATGRSSAALVLRRDLA